MNSFFASRRVLPTAEAGRELFMQRGCIGCHAVEGIGGAVGPAFSSLGAEKSESWLRFVLEQPDVALPNSGMPHPHLRPDQIDAMVAYLLTR
jgi:cytochrome c oxidase subunit 2